MSEFDVSSESSPMMAELYRRAKAEVRKWRPQWDSQAEETEAPAHPQRLLHELQVHQVELEMQNASLREARDQMESLLEKYTDLYDFAPVGYFSLDEQSRLVEVNLTGAAMLGVERSRLLHQPLRRFVAPASQAPFLGFLERVLAGNGKEFCEVALLKADGTAFWASLHGTLIKAAGGSPRRCQLVISDLTVLKAANDGLRTSEIRYRRLFEAAHDGVLLLDPGTRKITDANPFMSKLLGYSRAELIGKELFEIGLLKGDSASQQMFRKLRRQHEVRYEDLPLESQTGRHQEVEVVANLYLEDGHPVIQCNIRDISLRKEAEQLVRRSEALLSALVEQAPIGVYVVDARFNLQQANPIALAAMNGIHPLVGRGFAEIMHLVWPKPVADRMLARFQHTLKTGEPYQATQFAARRKDTGKMEHYEWQLQRVTLPAGENGVVCFFRDVTERRRAEAAERRSAVLSASNARLETEIVRRRAVEQSLTQTREHLKRLLVEAHEMQDQLRHLSRATFQVQEDERRSISRELHDVIAQTLMGINLRLGSLKQHARISPARLNRILSSTQGLVTRSVETVHQFARDLRPSVLDDIGLVPALHSYLKNFTTRTGLRTRLTACAEVQQLDEERRTVLFRVAQEAITNVGRHAKAQRVEVSVRRVPEGFCMRITDDGKSFLVERVMRDACGKHLGLLGMRERLEMVGGTLEVASAAGVGTTIEARIPLRPRQTKARAVKSFKRPS